MKLQINLIQWNPYSLSCPNLWVSTVGCVGTKKKNIYILVLERTQHLHILHGFMNDPFNKCQLQLLLLTCLTRLINNHKHSFPTPRISSFLCLMISLPFVFWSKENNSLNLQRIPICSLCIISKAITLGTLNTHTPSIMTYIYRQKHDLLLNLQEPNLGRPGWSFGMKFLLWLEGNFYFLI